MLMKKKKIVLKFLEHEIDSFLLALEQIESLNIFFDSQWSYFQFSS